MADRSAVRAGRLRHRVTLQSRSLTNDSFNQPIESWSDVGTYWAAVEPLTGREAERARQIKADASHRVVMRRVAAISPEQRLRFEGRTLDIVEVLDLDERGRTLHLTCSERR